MRVAGGTARLIPRGTIEELDAGRPLRARGCAGTASMGEGVQRVASLPAPMSVDQLMLRSPAPESAAAPAGGGRVVDPGTLHGSSVDGARVALDAPAWLVLGESFSEGWRAKCDGRDLGVARPVNGYANGWRAPRDCRDVEFAFAPQKGVRGGLRDLADRGRPAPALPDLRSAAGAPARGWGGTRPGRCSSGAR